MRLGRIGYVNCYPVYGAIDRGLVAVPASLVTGTPAELNNRLADGRLDVSVISAVAYARHAADFELLPDLAISSDGPVRSVLLFSRRAPEQLDGARVLVSTASRTSVELLALLARDRWNVALDTAPAPAEPGDLERLSEVPHDGVLVIGDAALLLSAQRAYTHVTDLGEAWKAWTGLPFVFAVWAVKRSLPGETKKELAGIIERSLSSGETRYGEIGRFHGRQIGLSTGEVEEYLEGFNFRLGERERQAMQEFRALTEDISIIVQ